MNRAELVDEIVEITGQPKVVVRDIITVVLHNITSSISSGKKVTLVGFGTFERRNRSARIGVNPQNPKQKLKIPAAKIPAFRAGRELKAIVDGRERLVAPQISGTSKVKKAAKSVASKKKAVGKKGGIKKGGAKKKGRR